MQIGGILHHKLTVRVAILGTILMAISLGWNIWQMSHRPDHSEEEALELQKLEQQQQVLEQNIDKLKQPFEQEKIIRDELNLQKEGETIIQLPPLPTPSPYPTIMPSPTLQPYQEWWEVIKGS